MHAPAAPITSLSPARTHVLLMTRQLYPTIAEVSAPVLRIAGARINPANNGPHTSMITGTSLTLKQIEGGAETKITVPPAARLDMPIWSPDGKRFAILNTTASTIHLYVGALGSAALRKIPGAILSDAIGNPAVWLAGSKELLVKLVPAGRPKPPAAPPAPAGPNVQESSGQSGPVRTYQDMLKTPYDETLFDYYATAQLASIDVATGKLTPIGKPAVITAMSPRPMANTFSLPACSAPLLRPHRYELPERSRGVGPRRQAGLPRVLGPARGQGAHRRRRHRPRNIAWRHRRRIARLVGGPRRRQPQDQVAHRDRLMLMRAPFTGQPVEVYKTQHRAMGITYGETAGWRLSPTTTATAAGCRPSASFSTIPPPSRNRSGPATCRTATKTPASRS